MDQSPTVTAAESPRLVPAPPNAVSQSPARLSPNESIPPVSMPSSQLPPVSPGVSFSALPKLGLSRAASINVASAPFVAPSSRRRMSILTSAESGDFVFSLPRRERRGSMVSATSGTGLAIETALEAEEEEEESSDEEEAEEEEFVEGPPEPLRIDTSAVLAQHGEDHRAALSPVLPSPANILPSPTASLAPPSPLPISKKISSATIGAPDTTPRFSPARKRFILGVVALAGMVAPLCTTIYLPALKTIQTDLQTTEVLINLSVTLFVVVLAIAPLVCWAPVSDQLGRRPVYLISLTMLVIASAVCAGSINVGMLIAFRCLQAAGSSAVLSIGAGTISDIFDPSERGKAMGTFFLGPLIGPIIGPMIGGVLSQYAGWRFIFGTIAIISFILLVLIYFLLPETLKGAKAKGAKKSGPQKRPNFFAMMKELRHPFVALVIFDVCCVFISLYGVSTLFSRQMSDTYGFSDSIVGVLYVGQGIGNVLGSVFGGWFSDWTMNAQRKPDETGVLPPPVPEHRLITTWVGAVLLPGGMLMYGWGLQFAVFWAVPLLGTVLIGAGLMMFSTSTNTYLIDCYPKNSASIVSVNNCFRYLVSAAAPLFFPYIIRAIGPGPTQTIFAVLNWVSWLGILAVWKWGTGWRMSRSPWKEDAVKEAEREERIARRKSAISLVSVTVSPPTEGRK